MTIIRNIKRAYFSEKCSIFHGVFNKTHLNTPMATFNTDAERAGSVLAKLVFDHRVNSVIYPKHTNLPISRKVVDETM